MWTFAELKAADAALNPALADPSAAADALNQQLTALDKPAVPVGVGSIHGALLLAPTGDWIKIQSLATQAFSAGYPASPTQEDFGIMAAKLAVVLAASKVDTIDPENWADFLSQVQAMVGAGAVTADTYAKVENVAVMSVPTWVPPVNAGDVQTARAQP